MMNKDKRRMTEKILNYALEIIFVLTGEEYTIVKKKSPHCGTDPLTGEVPIKCDDVAVYFSLEEWEYIEGHKELYKDLMIGTSEKCRTVKTPSNSSGHHDISAGGEIENERDKTDIQLMEAEAASCAEEDIADIISDTEQTEDQCARSHQVEDKNICEAISQVEVTRRQDENTDTVWISDEEDEKSENDAQLEEPCSDSCTDGTISLNMYCEPAAVWDSEEDVEDDPTLCNRVHEEDAERNSTNKLNMCDEENMASTSASYQCAPISCPNERSQSEYSDATMGIWEVKKETTDCANQTSRTAICEDHQAPSTPEKPCTSNKNRKQVTPGSKLNVDKTPHPDRLMSWNMFGEQVALWDSSERIVEDTSLSQRIKAEESDEMNAPSELALCNPGSLASTSSSYQYEQTCAQSQRFINEYNDATYGTWDVKKEESTDCSSQATRIAVCEDPPAPHAAEKPHTNNKNKKQATPETKKLSSTTHTDGPITWNMSGEQAARWDSSKVVMEGDQGLSKMHNSNNQLNLGDQGNLASTSMIYQNEQMLYTPNERLLNDRSNATFSTWNFKKKESVDYATSTSGISVSKDTLARCVPEKPFTSHKNRKILASEYKMNVNKKSHPGETPQKGRDCGRSFPSISHFITHQGLHTKEKPYACHQCGRCFSQRAYLVSHHRTHTGEKPYICSDCGRCFSQSSILVRHQRTHTGEKPYVCSICGRCFTRRSYLVAHQRLHIS